MTKIIKKEKAKTAITPPLSRFKLRSADEGREFAENIINAIHLLLLVLDKQLKVIQASQSFYDYFKLSADETIGKLIYDLGNHQWNIPELRELLKKTLSTKTIFENYEIEQNFSTIGKRIVLLNARQIEIGAGKEQIILLAIEDITDRKRAEEAFRKSKEKYQGIFENIQDVYYEASIDGTILEISPSIEVVSKGQYRRNDLIGKSIYDFYSDDRERKALLSILQQQGSVSDYIVTLKNPDGSLIPCSILAKIMFDDDGRPEKIVGSMRDITKRKRAEESMLESEAKLIEALKIAKLAYWEYDTALDQFTFNDQFYTLFHTTAEREGGYKMSSATYAQKFVYPEDKALVGAEILKSLKTADPCYYSRLDHRIICKDGEIKYITVHIRIDKDAQGRTVKQHGVNQDITERKHVEEIINQQNIKLQELNATKDKFFSIIAHDLKSPFSGFMNLTEIMATESKDFTLTEFGELSRSLNESAVNLYKLLENLLEWATIQQGAMSFNLKTHNLFKIVSDNILIVADRAAQKEISIINNVEESINVSADEKMINTVFRNLLFNAVKFTRKDGTITVNAKSAKNGIIEISVNDTGIGISENELKRLFKVGEKVSSKGTDNELSTGLGLLLCKDFIEKHGGNIWVESEEGKGSTFFFTLTGSCAIESNTRVDVNSKKY